MFVIGLDFLSLFFCSRSFYVFFFFKQKTAYEMRISDWSSDVCSSDLVSARRADSSGRSRRGTRRMKPGAALRYAVAGLRCGTNSSLRSFAWACGAVYPMRLGRSRDGRQGGGLGGKPVSSAPARRPEPDRTGPGDPNPPTRPWPPPPTPPPP